MMTSVILQLILNYSALNNCTSH